jgi:hypothetical protein
VKKSSRKVHIPKPAIHASIDAFLSAKDGQEHHLVSASLEFGCEINVVKERTT